MGLNNSVFSEKEMDAFEELTFLNRNEIKVAYKIFRNLAYEAVSENKHCELPMEVIQRLPELKENPYRDRICQVFSESGSGAMTFESFLDMLSVFSDKSPLEVKLEYAFRIYDFDDDHLIQQDDIRSTVLSLTRANGLHEEDQLNEEQMEFLIEKVMEEADIDIEKGINLQEFSSAIKQNPEFLEYFRWRL